MTVSSLQVANLSLCYTEWPSFAGSLHQSPCLFHPYPYNFTINPGFPTKIGRPLRNILTDHITVNINVSDSEGGSKDSIIERFLVDGSLPGRTVTTKSDLLTIEFAITCEDHYFGPRCARFCKTSVENFGHLACSETGEMICRPGWTGLNCSQIMGFGGDNQVISRLVGNVDDQRSFMKGHSGKHAFVFSAAIFFTVFVGYTLYVLNTHAKNSRHVHLLVTTEAANLDNAQQMPIVSPHILCE